MNSCERTPGPWKQSKPKNNIWFKKHSEKLVKKVWDSVWRSDRVPCSFSSAASVPPVSHPVDLHETLAAPDPALEPKEVWNTGHSPSQSCDQHVKTKLPESLNGCNPSPSHFIYVRCQNHSPQRSTDPPMFRYLRIIISGEPNANYGWCSWRELADTKSTQHTLLLALQEVQNSQFKA